MFWVFFPQKLRHIKSSFKKSTDVEQRTKLFGRKRRCGLQVALLTGLEETGLGCTCDAGDSGVSAGDGEEMVTASASSSSPSSSTPTTSCSSACLGSQKKRAITDFESLCRHMFSIR